MTDENAFLQAVIADPDDDAPRLIYADWLDEQGHSERAEFIRVQIALHGMCKADDPELYADLRRRERRLKRRYEKAWTEPMRPIAEGSFSRGFIESVSGSAGVFVTRGEVLFLLAPIRDLCLYNAGYCALPLSQCPYLNRPLYLSLSYGLRDRDIYHLANSRFLGRLTGLSLGRSQITDVGAMYLARSPYLGSLDDLYLKGYAFSRAVRAELRRRFGSRVRF